MTFNKANLRDLIAATGLVISNCIQIFNFSACVTMKFDGWPRKTIGHFFYTTSSFVYHFKSIGKFKTELTVQKRSIRVEIGDMLSCVTLKFDGWPWKTIGHLFYSTSSFMHHFGTIGVLKLELESGNANFGQIWRFLEPCDLEIWRMTLKNNRAPLQCYFKLCASVRSHWWIQNRVTVWKRPIWVKFDDF